MSEQLTAEQLADLADQIRAEQKHSPTPEIVSVVLDIDGEHVIFDRRPF